MGSLRGDSRGLPSGDEALGGRLLDGMSCGTLARFAMRRCIGALQVGHDLNIGLHVMNGLCLEVVDDEG